MLADHPLFQKRFSLPILLLVCIGLSAATANRVYQNYSTPNLEFDWSTRGHSDFHNGTLLPTRAFRNGDNPYEDEVCEKYTMARAAPAFSPWVFIMHLPLTYLSLHSADVLFFAYNVFLMAFLAWLSVRFCDEKARWALVTFVAIALLLSRPGHLTLFTGYFTTELAVGTAIALHFARSKPWLAGVGLLLASGKPNFIIPLMILMLCRRDFKAVLYGFVFSFIAAASGLLWLASFSSLGEVIEGLKEGQAAHHEDPSETPFFSWTRTDISGMVCKLMRTNPGAGLYFLLMFPLLAIPGLALWKIGKREYSFGASGLSGSIVALSILLSVYHQSYDCLLTVVPWVGVTFFSSRVLPEMSKWQHVAVSLLTTIPAGNYLSTLMAKEKLGLAADGSFWQGITLISGVSLLLALTVLLFVAFRQKVT